MFDKVASYDASQLKSIHTRPYNPEGNVLQSTSLFWDTYIVFGTVDIFVISQPKWLKFGVQAHLFKMIGHTNFQLSISCTFKVMKLLVEVKVEQNFDKN